MQNKPLLFGLLAGAIGLWVLLSWDPVAREELSDEAVTQTEPSPAPAPAPPAAAPPPTQPKAQPAAAPDPAPTAAPEEPAPEAPAAEPNFKLVTASREELDRANLPPPSPNGPLEALQKEFESAARDGSSAEMEGKIQEIFKLQHVPPELLESAVCHGNTCRVRTRWTSERAGGFTLAMTKLAIKMSPEGEEPMFDKTFAVGQAGERNSNGERSIDVYVRKRPDPARP
ncbi:MAG TPA: hypothetical protein VMF89_27480 [Polyangiales bacterium]|nr:hypothetical protein [Polyangiales bacterium]